MRLEVTNSVYVVSDLYQWVIRSHRGFIRTGKAGERKVEAIHVGYLHQIGTALSNHLIIPSYEAQGCLTAFAKAEQLEQELHDGGARFGRVVFGGGRFTLKPGLGDWLLSGGDGRHIASVPSIRFGLLTALERTLRADQRTIPYAEVDRVAFATALDLWSECRIVAPNEGEAGRMMAVVARRSESDDTEPSPILN